MKGQTLAEYVIILGVVVAALYVMGPSLKRGVQSVVKTTADQLASQKQADQDFSREGSHLSESTTNSKINNQKTVKEYIYTTNIEVNDTSDTTTTSKTDMGFSKQ
jgi:hypothetical protein